MKINIDIDCSAAEFRETLGLPDVKTVQDEWLKKMSAEIWSNPSNFDPGRLIESWMTAAIPNGKLAQDFFKIFGDAAKKEE